MRPRVSVVLLCARLSLGGDGKAHYLTQEEPVGEFFKVLPEFAFSFPAFRSVSQPADFLPNGGYAGVVFQAKIGLLFGARRKPPTPVVEAPVDPP